MGNVLIDQQTIVAVATLLTAIAALLRVLMHDGPINDTAQAVARVEVSTNGVLDSLRTEIASLQDAKATPDELAARRAVRQGGIDK